MQLLTKEGQFHLKLPSFEFSVLTHVDVRIAKVKDISQLLINSQNTIEHLTLHLELDTDITFAQHMDKLKKLKCLHLKGYLGRYPYL